MSSGRKPRSVLLAGATQAVLASATKQVVSAVFPITFEARLAFRADLTFASTAGGSPTVMLETSQDGVTWNDGKAVTVADGQVKVAYLPNVAGDQTYMPLQGLGRLSVTTAGGVSTSCTAAILDDCL